MKRFIISIMFVLLASQIARSQGTLYVSNLGQTPIGSATIGSDSWMAQSFYTGANSGGYVLDSIQLLMDAAYGNPNGYNVSIYSSIRPNVPNVSLGNLVGSLNPSTGGVFSYSASNLSLQAFSFYYIVVTATSPVTQGAFNWSATSSYTGGNNSWGISGLYYSSADGVNWTGHTDQIFQTAIYATAVPEPSIETLLGLGGLLLWSSALKLKVQI